MVFNLFHFQHLANSFYFFRLYFFFYSNNRLLFRFIIAFISIIWHTHTVYTVKMPRKMFIRLKFDFINL